MNVLFHVYYILQIISLLTVMKVIGKVKAATAHTKAKVVTKVTKVTKAKIVKQAVQNTDLKGIEGVLAEAALLPVTRGGWHLADGLKHLMTADTKFSQLIATHGIPTALRDNNVNSAGSGGDFTPLPIPTGAANDHYYSLLKIIIYQQLSAKSAEPILQRFLGAFKLKPKDIIKPSVVSKAVFETTYVDGNRKVLLNGVVSGLSESKAKYIKDLTEHFLDPTRLQGVDLCSLSDEELRKKLLDVKGLGPWSVDMFMLFDLQRANVLPVGDLVVRRGIAVHHGLPAKHFDTPRNQHLIPDLCKSWAPYSSLATCYMWKVPTDVK